jgi:hypothetical protein
MREHVACFKCIFLACFRLKTNTVINTNFYQLFGTPFVYQVQDHCPCDLYSDHLQYNYDEAMVRDQAMNTFSHEYNQQILRTVIVKQIRLSLGTTERREPSLCKV